MRVYLDTEFVDTGKTIDLISIGMVADDGKEFYRINASGNGVGVAANQSWLSKNVVPHLPVKIHHRSEFPAKEQEMFKLMAAGCWYTWDTKHPDHEFVVDGVQLRRDVYTFLSGYKDLELWADHAAYDHVVLAQLFGRMIDLPKGVPMFTHELMQEWERLGKPDLPEQLYGAHHALHDARHNKAVGDFLKLKEEQSQQRAIVLRGSTVMSDSDMDKFVSKVGRRLASTVLPAAGVRIKLADQGPVVGQIVHDPAYVITKDGMTSTSYNVAWLADQTDQLIARLQAPQDVQDALPEPEWEYRVFNTPGGAWRPVKPGPQAWLAHFSQIEFRRKPVEGE